MCRSDQVQEWKLRVHHHSQQAGQLLLHTGDPGQPSQGGWTSQGRRPSHHSACTVCASFLLGLNVCEFASECVPCGVQVNGHNVTNVGDDTAMTILRSSPRRLSMTLGRAVTNLVAPPSCDSLPDIVLHKTPSGQLGETTGQNDACLDQCFSTGGASGLNFSP